MSFLEKLCLDLIVQKFERFYHAFAASKDKDLQRNFQFLQRRFSVQLATMLYENKTLKEEYFDFLINEHLSFLDGKWLKNSRYLSSLEDVFRPLPNLTRICFSPSNLTRICFSPFGDEVLENIAKFCPKMVEIDVRISRVTDDGIEFLCKSENGAVPCPELKRVFIKPSRVTGKGVRRLIQSLPSLERIDYTNVPLLIHRIHEEKLSCFEPVHYYNLVELNLLKLNSLLNYTDVLKTCLTVCPKLESLTCYISNKEELNLFSNTHLKKLHLQFLAKDPSINIDNFLKTCACYLTYLKISDCNVSLPALAIHCPVLKEFFAHRVSFTDDNGDFQPIFPSLTECTFSHIDPSAVKAVCLIILSSPILKSLSFTYCILSREVQKQILVWCKSPSARKIDFWCLDLEIEFLKDILFSCPTLKDMTLTDCSVDVYDNKEILQNIAKNLPNKPKIVFFQVFSKR